MTKLAYQSDRGRWEQYGCGPVRDSGKVSPWKASEEVGLAGYLSGRNMHSWAAKFIKPSHVWRRGHLTWTALNNLVTTVTTPRKKVGLLAPSIWCPYPLTSTNVPFCADTSWLMPDGYMSLTCGINTAEAFLTASPTVTSCAVRSSRSLGRVRGYVARSSCGANWAGLTKMERTVRSFSASDFWTESFDVKY
jgi:hypothetical protein